MISTMPIQKTFAVVLIAGLANSVLALPSLQLDTTPGTFDPVTQTTIATSNPFVVRALIDASTIDLTRTFYLSAAILPSSTSPSFGSFTINGNTFSSSSNMQYGSPPVDAAFKDLPSHGIFDAWYAEVSFSAVGSPTMAAYNVQDNSSSPGLLHYVDFTVNVAGLFSANSVHFDLYTYDSIGTKIDEFAPFSHDAQSGHGLTVNSGPSVPDGGGTLLLLGAALTGLWAFRGKFGVTAG